MHAPPISSKMPKAMHNLNRKVRKLHLLALPGNGAKNLFGPQVCGAIVVIIWYVNSKKFCTVSAELTDKKD